MKSKWMVNLTVLHLCFCLGILAQIVWVQCDLKSKISFPDHRPLTGPEAVQIAEAFISNNGYTDRVPSWLTSKLTWENLDRSPTREDLIKLRYNTLQGKAFGYRTGRKGEAPGWTVIFRYRWDGETGNRGRAVTMNLDGSQIRVEHCDICLTAAQVKLKE